MKDYQGSCHCGAVSYRVSLDLDAPVTTCNCSICQRSGTMLSFVPADTFHLDSGADDLTVYQFGKKHLEHPFCKTCGIRSFSRGTAPDGKMMIAVNVRCLKDVELGGLTVKEFNGRKL